MPNNKSERAPPPPIPTWLQKHSIVFFDLHTSLHIIIRKTLLPSERQRHIHKMVEAAKEVWRRANAVCFDVDSTLIIEEGIDALAKYCGVGEKVAEW